jgi:hypothetical protein
MLILLVSVAYQSVDSKLANAQTDVLINDKGKDIITKYAT